MEYRRQRIERIDFFSLMFVIEKIILLLHIYSLGTELLLKNSDLSDMNAGETTNRTND